jgi:hypothetical protein
MTKVTVIGRFGGISITNGTFISHTESTDSTDALDPSIHVFFCFGRQVVDFLEGVRAAVSLSKFDVEDVFE